MKFVDVLANVFLLTVVLDSFVVVVAFFVVFVVFFVVSVLTLFEVVALVLILLEELVFRTLFLSVEFKLPSLRL